jgi:HD-like signal output (HDOD) protein
LFRHFETLKRAEVDLQQVWAHSWETARLAQLICREKGLKAKGGEEAFLAGLMHEIGRFILIDNFPGQFKAACDAARRTGSTLAASLQETFQTSPSQVGAYILELWGLPEAVVGAVSALHNPEREQANGITMKAALYIADHIASGKVPPDSFPVEEWKLDYLQAVGCVEQIPFWEESFAGETPGN